jgi:hypothetical protein
MKAWVPERHTLNLMNMSRREETAGTTVVATVSALPAGLAFAGHPHVAIVTSILVVVVTLAVRFLRVGAVSRHVDRRSRTHAIIDLSAGRQLTETQYLTLVRIVFTEAKEHDGIA